MIASRFFVSWFINNPTLVLFHWKKKNKCIFYRFMKKVQEKRDFKIQDWIQSEDLLAPAFLHLSRHLKSPHLPQPPRISVQSVRLRASDLPPPVFNLQTSSAQISALLSPAQLLKVGPRRNCRKVTLAICFIWNLSHVWPCSQVQKKTDLQYSMTRFRPRWQKRKRVIPPLSM